MKKIILYSVVLLSILIIIFALNYRTFLYGIKALFYNENNQLNVLVRVNENSLTYDDFIKLLPSNSNTSLHQKKEFLRHWKESEMLAQKAINEGLKERHDVKLQIEKMIQQYLADLMIQEEMKKNVFLKDSEILEYYEAHKDEFKREYDEYHLQIIVLKTKNGADRIYNEITKKNADFGEMAKLHSIAASSENNGDIGVVSINDMDSKMASSLSKAHENNIIKPIELNDKYIIAKVLKIESAGTVKSFEDVKGFIKEIILDNKRSILYKKLINELEKKYYIYENELLLTNAPDSLQ